MLVGAEPDRPSASYKLNTLVSNRFRETTSGKAGQPRGSAALRPDAFCSPSREALQVVGGTCALELNKPGAKSWPHCLTSCLTLANPLTSESASSSVTPHMATVSTRYRPCTPGTGEVHGRGAADACISPAFSLLGTIDPVPLSHAPPPFKLAHHPCGLFQQLSYTSHCLGPVPNLVQVSESSFLKVKNQSTMCLSQNPV